MKRKFGIIISRINRKITRLCLQIISTKKGMKLLRLSLTDQQPSPITNHHISRVKDWNMGKVKPTIPFTKDTRTQILYDWCPYLYIHDKKIHRFFAEIRSCWFGLPLPNWLLEKAKQGEDNARKWDVCSAAGGKAAEN